MGVIIMHKVKLVPASLQEIGSIWHIVHVTAAYPLMFKTFVLTCDLALFARFTKAY